MRLLLEGLVLALAPAHKKRAYHAGNDAHAGEKEGQSGTFAAVKGQANGHRPDDGGDIRLEQVGTHAGDVAHVVADVVGNHRRVARIILRDVLLQLAHQVGAHIGSFGVDASPHAGKQRHRTGPKTEARHGADDPLKVATQQPLQSSQGQDKAQGSKPDDGEPEDASAIERHP